VTRFLSIGLLGLLMAVSGCAATEIRLDDPRLAGMVRVPAGEFIMGHSLADGRVGVKVGIDSVPVHRRYLPTFWIDRTEVTVADYRAFAKTVPGHPFPLWAYTVRGPRNNGPVTAVTFDDAQTYCHWKGKRLPTEAEWEKAARGTDGRLFPWGDDWRPDWVVHRDLATNGPSLVGSKPRNASPYGALDMAGNVMEWTDTWYNKHPGSTLVRRQFGEMYRVLKGGSWEMREVYARSANRFSALPINGQPSFGFRCVLSDQKPPAYGQRISQQAAVVTLEPEFGSLIVSGVRS
jgi:formylglycine-generating enzyme required for sulfatase activity